MSCDKDKSSEACREESGDARIPLSLHLQILNQKGCQEGTAARPATEKNLEMRVYRSVLRLWILRNNTIDEWMKGWIEGVAMRT